MAMKLYIRQVLYILACIAFIGGFSYLEKPGNIESDIRDSLKSDDVVTACPPEINGTVEYMEHGFPIEVEISDIAVNRFIAAQAPFPTLSGVTPGGITYHISITTPTIIFNTNTLKANFTIMAYTSIGNYFIPVRPTLIIPPLTISTAQVAAFLANFPELINGSPLPAELKTIIINGYNNLPFILYPSKLLKGANSQVPAYLDLNVNDILFGYEFLPSKIKFTGTAAVEGKPPVITGEYLKQTFGEMYKMKVRFHSNVQTTLRLLRIYRLPLSSQLYNESPNILIQKNTTCEPITAGTVAYAGPYVVQAVFASPYGEYVRQYYANFGNIDVWSPMCFMEIIN